jgi:hypothetical protein
VVLCNRYGGITFALNDEEANPVTTAAVFLKFVEFDYVPVCAPSRSASSHTDILCHDNVLTPLWLAAVRQAATFLGVQERMA